MMMMMMMMMMMIKRVATAVRELGGSTVRFMYCYRQVAYLFVLERRNFLSYFFETADRYTTGPRGARVRKIILQKKCIFYKSKNN